MNNTTSHNEKRISDIFEATDASRKWLFIFLIQGCFIVVINLVVIIVIASKSQLLKLHSNKFLRSFLFSHCVFGCIEMMIAVTYWNKSFSGCKNCYKTYLQRYMAIFVACLFTNLLVLTLDRFVYIKFPFQYSKLTEPKIYIIISVSWVLPLLLLLVPNLAQAIVYDIISLSLILVSFLVLLISNICIYRVARAHQKKVKKQRKSFCQHDSDANEVKHLNSKKHYKAVKICFGMVVTFLTFWIPLFVHDAAKLIGFSHPTFTIITVLLAFSNSAIDPILYSVLSVDLRSEVHRILQGLVKK